MKMKKRIAGLLVYLMIFFTVVNYAPIQVYATGDVTYSVDFGAGSWTQEDITVTADKSGVQTLAETDTITLSGFNADIMDVLVSSEDGFMTTLVVTDGGTTSLSARTAEVLPETPLYFGIIFRDEATKEANVTVSSNVNVAIQFRSASDKNEATIYSDPGNTNYLFGSGTISGLPESGTIYVAIEPELGASNTYEYIRINGVDQTFINGTAANVYEVEVSDSYVIEISGSNKESYTIMWTNYGAINVEGTDFAAGDCIIGNGKAYVKKVYNNNAEMIDISNEINNIENGCVDDEGKGYVALEEGNVVVFEFVPNYGCQLTSIGATDTEVGPIDEVNEYIFDMPGSHVHFSATFTPTEDVVAANADIVAEGDIFLSGEELNGGSAKLEVNNADIGNQGDFEAAAEGYVVSDYLDISLHNIFYKGKPDAEDVWSTPIENLSQPAEITLRLENGINGETVKIVHEKVNESGGMEYELLDANYNPDTQEITFSTSSFSNYAIAYVESNQNGGNNNEEFDYWVNFAPGEWPIGEETVYLQLEGFNEQEQNIGLFLEDVITLKNFNPETMDAILIVDDEVTLRLNVDQSGVTSLANVDGGIEVLPPFGTGMIFCVVEKIYSVDFESGSWTFGDVTVEVSADGVIANGVIELRENDMIPLVNFNPETMEVWVFGENDFSAMLTVTDNWTCLSERSNKEEPLPSMLLFAIINTISDITDSEDNACNAVLDEVNSVLMEKLLTPEDITRFENGDDVKVYLEVEDISDNVPQEDVPIINSVKGDATIGMCLDIDLLKQINAETPSNITETNGAVTISLVVPDLLINSNQSITRTYRIIRIHNGVPTVLPCDFDTETQRISFETDQFSTYALIYSDQKKAAAVGGSLAKVKDAVPKTGDDTNKNVWFVLAIVSGAGIIFSRKKRTE